MNIVVFFQMFGRENRFPISEPTKSSRINCQIWLWPNRWNTYLYTSLPCFTISIRLVTHGSLTLLQPFLKYLVTFLCTLINIYFCIPFQPLYLYMSISSVVFSFSNTKVLIAKIWRYRSGLWRRLILEKRGTTSI